MKFKEFVKKRYQWIVFILLIIFGTILALRVGDLSFSPFENSYVYNSVSSVEEGSDGKRYVIDGQKKVFLVLDQNGNIDQRYVGGSLTAPFYYATHSCADEEGNIYLSDIVYGEYGNRIQEERIIKLNEYGSEILWTQKFGNNASAPLQYGQIQQLDYVDGKICALFKINDKLSYQTLDYKSEGDNVKAKWITESKWDSIGKIESAQYEPDQDILAVSLRNGNIFYGNKKDQKLKKIPSYIEEQIPVSVTIGEDGIYYSDIENLGLYHIDLDTLKTTAIAEEGECMYPYIRYGKASKSLLLSDYECYYVMDADGEVVTMESGKLIRYPQYVITWIALLFTVIFLILILISLIIAAGRRIMASDKREYIIRFILVLVACILVGSTIAWSEIQDMKDNQLTNQLNSMELFAQTISLKIDGDDIKKLANPSSYGSKTFEKVREPLDSIVDESYKIGQYYYYCIYAVSEDGIFVDGIMDYEDSIAVSTPSDVFEGEAYTKVLEEGKNYKEKGEGSAYGSWMYVDVPIKNESGQICGFLEIGTSLDMFNKQMKTKVFENICSSFCNAAVVAMLILEILFLMSFFEYKKDKELSKEYQNVSVPIRAVNFLTYAGVGLIDAFLIIMCTNLFKQDSSFLTNIIPAGIGAALPLSSELLLSSLSSLFGGVLAERFGTKKIITIGFVIQFFGFLSCALQMNYMGILLGLSLAGLGMGLVYVGSNTMAAMAGNEKAREKGFADVAAGGMSGATVGVGLGALILSVGNYKTVFLIGSSLMIMGALLCLTRKEKEEVVSEVIPEEAEETKGSIGEAFRFLFNRRVFIFFVFLVTPFMMTLSFKDYFFPTYAETVGITEVQIGQLQLLCGMLVLYMGPYLSHYFIEKIGGGKSLLLSMFLVIAGMGIFLIAPSLITAIIAMALLYIAHSFAYTCQYFYFDELPAVARYGDGGALGIFSMFENIGQTLGPILFGAALMLGFWKGIASIVVVLGICLAMFLVFGLRKERGDRK